MFHLFESQLMYVSVELNANVKKQYAMSVTTAKVLIFRILIKVKEAIAGTIDSTISVVDASNT